MHDIIALRQFYSSPLGRQVKCWLRHKLAQYVSRTHGETLVGLGYAAPLLRAVESIEHPPDHIIAIMPGSQGAIYWPIHGNNRAALGNIDHLPFQDNSVHWLVMLHALEYADAPQHVLEEAYRVLVPGGKVLMFVPHRHRPWRWWGSSPFKEGKAYRYGELKRMVHEAEFTITEYDGALMLPPFYHPFLARAIKMLERFLSVLIPGLGSLMCVEVEKQIYAATKQKRKQRALRIGVQPITATAVPNTRDLNDD